MKRELISPSDDISCSTIIQSNRYLKLRNDDLSDTQLLLELLVILNPTSVWRNERMSSISSGILYQ